MNRQTFSIWEQPECQISNRTQGGEARLRVPLLICSDLGFGAAVRLGEKRILQLRVHHDVFDDHLI